MISYEKLIQLAYKKPKCIDGRDLGRVIRYIKFNDIKDLLKDDVDESEWNKTILDFTEENVLNQLSDDLEFAFEKALNKRGLSAGIMYETIKTYMYILEDEELLDFSDYAQYGLPLFKAVAVKYDFENPIGDDDGDEYEYSAEYDYEE